MLRSNLARIPLWVAHLMLSSEVFASAFSPLRSSMKGLALRFSNSSTVSLCPAPQVCFFDFNCLMSAPNVLIEAPEVPCFPTYIAASHAEAHDEAHVAVCTLDKRQETLGYVAHPSDMPGAEATHATQPACHTVP